MTEVKEPPVSKKLPNDFGIHFGAMSDPIAKQIRKQGFIFEANTVAHFQKDFDALIRLRIRSLISQSEANKSEKRLYNNIVDHICKLNKVAIGHLKL